MQDIATIAELIERLQRLEVDQATRINFNITEVVKNPSVKKQPKQLKKLLANIDQFGGMSVDTSDEYLKHAKAFKEDFTFKSDL